MQSKGATSSKLKPLRTQGTSSKHPNNIINNLHVKRKATYSYTVQLTSQKWKYKKLTVASFNLKLDCLLLHFLMTRWYKTQADAQATGVSFSLWPNRMKIKCAYKLSWGKKAFNYVKKGNKYSIAQNYCYSFC